VDHAGHDRGARQVGIVDAVTNHPVVLQRVDDLQRGQIAVYAPDGRLSHGTEISSTTPTDVSR
jgi:hypothetical protein